MSGVGIDFALMRAGLNRGEIRHEKTRLYRHERLAGIATLRVRSHRADRRQRTESDAAANGRYPTVAAAANGRHPTNACAHGGHARARAPADGGGGPPGARESHDDGRS